MLQAGPKSAIKWGRYPRASLMRFMSSHVQPDVVVVGGGIVGSGDSFAATACSELLCCLVSTATALELAERGKQVLVLEQNTITSGSTWHAAGLVTTVFACRVLRINVWLSSKDTKPW